MWLVYSSIVPCCHRNGFHRFLCMPRQNNRDTLQEKRGPALLFVLLFNLLEWMFVSRFLAVRRNPHALVYLRSMLLISRCHVIALLVVLLFNLLGNQCSWTASFAVPRYPHELVYLRIMLLISRCHVIALLFVLLFNLLGNRYSWTASFGVPRNPDALVYLFKEVLLISRCHVIALLFVLLFNLMGNECTWAASFAVPRNRMHWFIYLKNYCSYLVAMPFQSRFFFAFRSVSCGWTFAWISFVVVSVLSWF
jgi:hypothetical protein